MRYIKNIKSFNESISDDKGKGNSSLISTLCISMLLLNSEFLDNVLDKGLRARYTTDSSVFLNDLKNLLFTDNRLRLGKYENGRCVLDSELSKINQEFNEYSTNFDIEKDWNKLLKARKIAKNISTKLLETETLESDMISYLYWLGPNKDSNNNMDIVIELNNGKQYPIYVNKKLTISKTKSFNTFGEILIGDKVNDIYGEKYISKWNKLTQEWIRVIYENSKSNIQKHIEKFIDPSRINTITYFDYFDIKHSNRNFKNLGEYMEEFDKNILDFSKLMSEIFKTSDESLINPVDTLDEWEEIKKFILYSKIIEHLYTESFRKLDAGTDKRIGKYVIAGEDMKMRLIKLLVEIMNIGESGAYYFGNSGNDFKKLPSRQYFRDIFDRLDVKYDYHTELTDMNKDSDNDGEQHTKENDFIIRYDLDNEPLCKLNLNNSWSGGEMSGNLSVKMSIELNNDFNSLVDITHHDDNTLTETNIPSRKHMVNYLKENWKDVKYSEYSFINEKAINNLDLKIIKVVYDTISSENENIENLKNVI